MQRRSSRRPELPILDLTGVGVSSGVRGPHAEVRILPWPRSDASRARAASLPRFAQPLRSIPRLKAPDTLGDRESCGCAIAPQFARSVLTEAREDHAVMHA